MQYQYKTSINGLTTKELTIYSGTELVGSIKGSFDNVFKRFVDELIQKRSLPSFITYELKDSIGNVRCYAEMSGFTKSAIMVTYYDRNNIENNITIENMKDKSFEYKKAEFKYKETECLIYKENSKNPFNPKPAELFFGEELVASWNISMKEKKVVVKINNYKYVEDRFLIFGIFHAFLYPTKG
ncbi:tubby C-terminal domain-like protein [Halalkalibacillus halophilus]|uniref:tubby C-terminal domain-like protein n=1 Tax=Halalkalibacillus halophilus TaxID=392827 RepID=UPI00040CD030|nr:hypothetical protein [Halalkalibacillus halophilus]